MRPESPDADAEALWDSQLSASAVRVRQATGNPVNYLDVTLAGLQDAVRSGEPIVGSWRQDAVHLFGKRLDVLLRANR